MTLTGSPDFPSMGQNVTSDGNASDQTLLRALQDFIVPLIQMVNPTRNHDERPLELEAKRLIAALQEFVSNVIQNSQYRTQTSIKVRMAEGVKEDYTPPLIDVLPVDRAGFIEDTEGSELGGSREIRTLEERESFHDKLLKALREHVFNVMPIRLLRFEQHGYDLKIDLVERGVIHAHLEATMRAHIHQKDHFPLQYIKWKETDNHAIKRLVSKYTKYAILSHTWSRLASGEVTFADWNKGQFDVGSPGYKKVINFCKTAWSRHGVTFGWMDTICINKESSSELDESIRSMYNWYARSRVCMVYLAETEVLSGMHADPWFTRGWTLQELLAPPDLKFYNRSWQQLVESSENDRFESQITDKIERATTISANELWNIHRTPISRRMQLAASRQVTREEDTAYSLMGIFDVSITTAYGEGAKRAFSRLLQQILATSYDILDLFNWAGPISPGDRVPPSSMLPPSPQYYLKRSTNPNLYLGTPIEPLNLTHLGIRFPVILMRGLSVSASRTYNPIGKFSATVPINPVDSTHIPAAYNLLDKEILQKDGQNPVVADSYQITLAIINFSHALVDAEPGSVFIPETCLAIPMVCEEKVEKAATGWDVLVQIIETHEPVVFKVEVRDDRGERDSWKRPRIVHRDRLKEHGMQLVCLYL